MSERRIFDGFTSSGVNFVQGTNRAACSSPNPSANLVGLFSAGTKVEHWGSSAFFVGFLYI
ncbi:hypothetical protein J2T20_002255 [Paenibacillus wynnii]|nr:hypothetical protein [Paenibacillus wynnii]